MRHGLAFAAMLAVAANAGPHALTSAARAQAPQSYATAGVAPYTYRVRAGDTLPKLAAAYFSRPEDAATVQRLNNLSDTGRLEAGTTLSIPANLLRTDAQGAQVTSFRGDVTVGGQGPVRVGMVVGEGVRIATGANSAVSFRLGDGSAVTLPSLSTIRIVRLRRVLISNRVERVLLLEAGRSETHVTPSKDGSTAFEIRTPVSVAAVRGTDFRVAYAPDEKAATAGVVKGAVGIEGKDGAIGLDAGYGARSDIVSAGTPVPLLPPPDIQSPVGHRRDGTLVFSFVKMSDALSYRLVVSTDADFRDLRTETMTKTGQAEVPSLPNGTYFIRATAIDIRGIEGLPMDIPFDHHLTAASGATGGAARAGG